jgi:hypothetical protein
MRFRIGRMVVEYDRDYGIDRRTGWSSAVRGHYVAQFVSLPAALLALWRNR